MAVEVYAEMKQRGIEPNVITCNTLISACEKVKRLDKASEIFAEMKQRGLEPTGKTNTFTYHAEDCETGTQTGSNRQQRERECFAEYLQEH